LTPQAGGLFFLICGLIFFGFLAAAEESQVPLLTLDRRLYERAKLTRNVQLI